MEIVWGPEVVWKSYGDRIESVWRSSGDRMGIARSRRMEVVWSSYGDRMEMTPRASRMDVTWSMEIL